MDRARKRGRPAGELGVKSATLSLRLPPYLRAALVTAAERNKRRSLSEEIMFRLRSTFDRDRDADRPRRIKALSEMVELVALGIEQATERRFNEDRYTAEQLAKAVELLLWKYSPQAEAAPQTKAEIPPAVVKAANTMPAQVRDTYPDQLGVIEAGAIIALLEGRLRPPHPDIKAEHWPPKGYPESWLALWQARNDLNPRRHKK